MLYYCYFNGFYTYLFNVFAILLENFPFYYYTHERLCHSASP